MVGTIVENVVMNRPAIQIPAFCGAAARPEKGEYGRDWTGVAACRRAGRA